MSGQIDRGFVIPEGIVSHTTCRETGLLAPPACPAGKEYFRAGHAPVLYCSQHRYLRLNVCAYSGLLPGPNCREVIEKEFLWGEQPKEQCQECQPPRTL